MIIRYEVETMHVRTPVTSILWDVPVFSCTTVNQMESEMLCQQLPAKLDFKLVCPGNYPTFMRSYRGEIQGRDTKTNSQGRY